MITISHTTSSRIINNNALKAFQKIDLLLKSFNWTEEGGLRLFKSFVPSADIKAASEAVEKANKQWGYDDNFMVIDEKRAENFGIDINNSLKYFVGVMRAIVALDRTA